MNFRIDKNFKLLNYPPVTYGYEIFNNITTLKGNETLEKTLIGYKSMKWYILEISRLLTII